MKLGLGKAVVVAALLASGLTLSAAHAVAPLSHYAVGGCFFEADSEAMVTQPDTYVGVLGVAVVSADPVASIRSAECYFGVNGNEADHLGPIAGPVPVSAKPTTFVAHDGDVTELCTIVHWSDGDTTDSCQDSTDLQLPPQQVYDLLDSLDSVEKANVDPVVCPILAAHAGTYGPFFIDAQGDVYGPDLLGLGIAKLWDCPAYDA
jgi:hypothetical protein